MRKEWRNLNVVYIFARPLGRDPKRANFGEFWRIFAKRCKSFRWILACRKNDDNVINLIRVRRDRTKKKISFVFASLRPRLFLIFHPAAYLTCDVFKPLQNFSAFASRHNHQLVQRDPQAESGLRLQLLAQVRPHPAELRLLSVLRLSQRGNVWTSQNLAASRSVQDL